MADRGSAFLRLAVGGRRARRAGRGLRFGLVQARGGGKLTLPLDLQLQLELFDLGLNPFVLFEQLGIASPLEIELPPKHPEILIGFAGGVDERSEGGAAQMRAVADLRAGVFVLGVEAELHRHPFLRMPHIPLPPVAS